MNKKDRAQLLKWQNKVKVLLVELDDMADEIEAYQLKQQTQRSPEWRGGANC